MQKSPKKPRQEEKPSSGKYPASGATIENQGETPTQSTYCMHSDAYRTGAPNRIWVKQMTVGILRVAQRIINLVKLLYGSCRQSRTIIIIGQSALQFNRLETQNEMLGCGLFQLPAPPIGSFDGLQQERTISSLTKMINNNYELSSIVNTKKGSYENKWKRY